MSSSAVNIANKLTNPTSNANLYAIANLVLDEDNNYANHNPVSQISTFNNNESELNLCQFCRLYTIAGVPIMDFFIVYILFYVLNSICLKYDYKLVLLATIVVVIVFNIFTNKNISCLPFWIIVLVVTLYYIFRTKFSSH